MGNTPAKAESINTSPILLERSILNARINSISQAAAAILPNIPKISFLSIFLSHLTPVVMTRFSAFCSFKISQQYLIILVGGIPLRGINDHILTFCPLYIGCVYSQDIPFFLHWSNTFRTCCIVCGASTVVMLCCTTNGT